MKTIRSIARKVFCIIIVAIIAFVGYNMYLRTAYPDDYIEIAKQYSDGYGIEASLTMAVIKCESGFDKNAESSAGAKGLMQLTEETFYDVREMVGDGEEYTFLTHWDDAHTNIKYGTKYISYLFGIFDGNKIAVIASYNAGMGNVKQWLGDDGKLSLDEIRFPETEDYVKKVLKAQEVYNKLYS